MLAAFTIPLWRSSRTTKLALKLLGYSTGTGVCTVPFFLLKKGSKSLGGASQGSYLKR